MNHLTGMKKNRIGIGKNPVRRSKMRNNPLLTKSTGSRYVAVACGLKMSNHDLISRGLTILRLFEWWQIFFMMPYMYKEQMAIKDES